ncbi:MAG: 3-deoxy-manno-octulosonate cytidylyltransferase [Proteobacteria bacterium]|nr:3-deoxy-manno-octulosonate cytidylyltransferase [Pseudomonadota bacterium]
MKNTAIVIPARFASTRFPGKPLVSLGSKPMIEYIYRACKESKKAPYIVIATDNEKIFGVSKGFISSADSVIMTPPDLRTGTDRVAWVAKEIDAEYIVNIQCDEPLLTGRIIDTLIDETIRCSVSCPVATLATWSGNIDEYKDINVVKVAVSNKGEALYFSRASIPCSRNGENKKFLKHIGLYGFKKDFLLNITNLNTGYLEKIESLEQLRFLENGFGIRVGIVEAELMGIDTPAQVGMVEEILRKRGKLL